MQRIAISLIFWVGVVFQAHAACDAGETVVRFGTTSDVDSAARTRAVKLLSDAIDREMQGKLCLQIVTDDSLYKGTLAIAALQSGDVQMTAPTYATLSGFARNYRVFEIPFAFRDIYALQRFQALAKKQLSASLLINDVQLLEFLHERFKQISAKRAVSNPASARGLKFRQDDGKTFATQVRLMRATRQTIAENDLPIALKQGRIDAQISSWQQLEADKTASTDAVITETNHGVMGYQLITSKSWWDKLNPALARQLTELIARISRQANFETVRRQTSSKRALMRGGIPVHTLTKKQRRKWLEVMQSIRNRDGNATLLAAVDAANTAP